MDDDDDMGMPPDINSSDLTVSLDPSSEQALTAASSAAPRGAAAPSTWRRTGSTLERAAGCARRSPRRCA